MTGTMLASLFSLVALLVTVCKSQNSCSYSQYMEPGGQTFTITSPDYPSGKYQPGTSCVWRAFTNRWARISLECPYVEIPVQGETCLDQLMVSDTENGNQGDVYCGLTKIYHDSEGSQLTVQISSSPRSSGGRFTCNLKAANISSRPTQPNCACGYSFRPRIVGGTETGINEFPSMAGLVSYTRGEIFCGATIITERYSLTAAHCLKGRDVKDIAVLVGEHDITTGKETNATKLIRASNYWVYPEYDQTNTANDVGIVMIAQRLAFNARVGPACLPFNYPGNFQGESVQILGWGLNEFGGKKAERLQKATVKVMPMQDCQTVYGNKINAKGQLCCYGGNKDSCQFDSGGPVLWIDPNYSRLVVVGIQSYGRGCAFNYPSVNTKVYTYLGWIESIISDDFYCVI